MIIKLHTLPPSDDFDVSVGDVFEAHPFDDERIITAIDGEAMLFTLKPDENGMSIHDWFTIVEE